MTQAAWGGLDDSVVPTRYVFDEGHHVFDAADSAFSAELSGLETAEMRRWLLGAEGGRSRARGLQAADRGAGRRPRPCWKRRWTPRCRRRARCLRRAGHGRIGEEHPELGGLEPAGRTRPRRSCG